MGRYREIPCQAEDNSPVDGAVAYATKGDGLEIRRGTVDHGRRQGGPYCTKKAAG